MAIYTKEMPLDPLSISVVNYQEKELGTASLTFNFIWDKNNSYDDFSNKYDSASKGELIITYPSNLDPKYNHWETGVSWRPLHIEFTYWETFELFVNSISRNVIEAEYTRIHTIIERYSSKKKADDALFN